ncbi:MAG: hypothetical protein HZB16_18415 [Armatimonadetes bacterium]|nr:hypothetical protein [Armatimonadota bacterium]
MTPNASLQPAAAGCPTGCLLTGGAIAVGLLALGVLTVAVVPPLGIFALILGAIAAAAVAWAALARQQSEMLDVELDCQPSTLRLGETLNFAVTVSAKKPCRLSAGTVTLRCRERAISRGGTSDTTYLHTVYEDTRDLPAEDHLMPGSSWSAEAALPIPRELPATFVGRNNFIEWHLVLHIGIPGPLLDIRREQPLVVVPELVEGASDEG